MPKAASPSIFPTDTTLKETHLRVKESFLPPESWQVRPKKWQTLHLTVWLTTWFRESRSTLLASKGRSDWQKAMIVTTCPALIK